MFFTNKFQPFMAPDGGGDGGDGGEPGKTFTQADIDRIVADRLTREKAKFADYEDIKAKAAKFDESQASAMTEQEKLKTALDEAQAKGTKAVETANKRLISAELKVEAAANGVPADRIAAALKLVDTAEVVIDENGNVTGASDAVKNCLKANAFLLAGVQGGANLGGNPIGGNNNPSEVNPWSKGTFNLTKQAKIIKENPTLAAQLKAAAK